MDHVINYITEYMWFDINELHEEYESGQYQKLKECPSYETVKAYCDALKPLYKYCYRKSAPTPRDFIDW